MMAQKPKGYWTKNKCLKEALKYNTKKELIENCISCFNSSYKNGWLEIICKHMAEVKKPNGYWNKDNCRIAALKCKTQLEFRHRYSGAIAAAYKNNWIKEICLHMKKRKSKNLHY